jgi:hypothetical protein
MRLRQAVDHPYLVIHSATSVKSQAPAAVNSAARVVAQAEAAVLESALNEAANSICRICNDEGIPFALSSLAFQSVISDYTRTCT